MISKKGVGLEKTENANDDDEGLKLRHET